LNTHRTIDEMHLPDGTGGVIEVNFPEPIAVEVCFDYSPGDPGSQYLANGDPGDEPELPDLSITSVVLLVDMLVIKDGVHVQRSAGCDISAYLPAWVDERLSIELLNEMDAQVDEAKAEQGIARHEASLEDFAI
jgi:hypothetical protein